MKKSATVARMAMDKTGEVLTLATKPFKPEPAKSVAGMARSRRMLLIERQIEHQFMVCCTRIRLEDMRKHRADSQREDRRNKRNGGRRHEVDGGTL
jgi:hypothetical protein